VKTRRARPTGPEESLGASERLAWLVVNEETGTTIGKITRVYTLPGRADYWQAYGVIEVPYGEPPREPIRLGAFHVCGDAQDDIEQWYVDRENAEREQALADIRGKR
jgi:hypothetical protein